MPAKCHWFETSLKSKMQQKVARVMRGLGAKTLEMATPAKVCTPGLR